jgi:leucyl aminopeptidase
MKQDVSVSKFLEIRVANPKRDKLNAQCEVIGVSDTFALHKSLKAFQPLVNRLRETGELSGRAGAGCLVRFYGHAPGMQASGQHLLLVGLGKDADGVNALGPVERLRRLGAQVQAKLAAEKIKDVVVHLESFLLPAAKLGLDSATASYAFVEGMGLGAYEFKKYVSKKDEDKTPKALRVALATTEASKATAYAKGIERATAMLAGAGVARDLGNEPSNELFPSEYADRVRELATANHLKCTILDEKALAKEKMGLLLGVGQGSVKPPRLIVVEYNPKKAPKKHKTIAFVGKGITFDSGGISIKPAGKMEDMKHDMCGSAAVIGATVAAAKLGLPVRIITVIAAAENMPSGNAIQPGNILVARSGKTVEIINTDAEGRLVLADALDWVQDMSPDYIVDLATLTGAATITLGKVCAGLMSNDAGLAKLAHGAAREAGERIWELPLFEEYFDDLKSEYADMRNSGDSPANGTAKGAMFLKQFVRKGTRWAHLDIASVAYATGGIVPYNPKKSSSGYGVRLLVELAKRA